MKHCIFVLLLFVLSCHKDPTQEQPANNNVEATVLYTGDVTTDGCDWMVVVNTNEHYHPDSLPDTVKQDGLPVLLSFTKTTDSFYCGIAANAYPVMHVISIRPR